MIKKIISGGQTGADQGALDAAIKYGFPYGGWIPKGRKTEAGLLPDEYKLNEMPSSSYPERTEQNVIDSDGTVIITHGKLSGGSKLTDKLAEKHFRPCLHVNFNKTPAFAAASEQLVFSPQMTDHSCRSLFNQFNIPVMYKGRFEQIE